MLEAFEAIPDRESVVGEALRLPIQDVYRFDHRRILAGRVESGTVTVGDQVLFRLLAAPVSSDRSSGGMRPSSVV